MPRRDRYEDDEYDRPRKKSGVGGVALGVIIGGGVLLVVIAGGCVGLIWLFGRGAQEKQKQETVAAKQLPTRDEFRAMYIGKTKDEVTAALGRPAHTNEIGRSQVWQYEKVTRDPASGKVDYSTSLWFDENGKVERITF